MAAPVVTGTVALMLQANPVADAECGQGDPAVHRAGVLGATTRSTQGAGFLNAKGAVELARVLRAASGDALSRHVASGADRLIWGNRSSTGGRLTPDANAWSTERHLGRGHDAHRQHGRVGRGLRSTSRCA